MIAGHIPRKRFGQHFLTDRHVIDAIVHEVVHPQSGQSIVEIGPGLGALTRPLLEQAGRLTVIEIDRDLAARWQSKPAIDVIEQDVLKTDFSLISESLGATKLIIVGNLPYNISTPVLFHLMNHVDVIQVQCLMLQKDVVDRMVAVPCTSAYGRLSVMLQWRYAIESLMQVPPDSFEPPPKVWSTVVRMVPRPSFVSVNPTHLEAIVKLAFSQRRKLLRHTLGAWLDALHTDVRFDIQRRAEEVPVDEYIDLCAAVTKSAHHGLTRLGTYFGRQTGQSSVRGAGAQEPECTYST